MKAFRTLLVIIVFIALGAWLAAEHLENLALQRQVATLQQADAARAAQLEASARVSEELRQRLKELKDVLAQVEDRNKALAGEPAKSPSPEEPKAAGPAAEEKEEPGSTFTGMMQKMFTDPEMKKVMKSQQTMAIQMMYGDMGKELNLSPDESRMVMDLLAERQMAIAGKSMELLGGGKDAKGETAEALGEGVQTTMEHYNQQLEELLGPERWADFSSYERTIGDRMQMTQYKQAFNASGAPLDEQQSQGLLEIMKEERMKVPASPLEQGNRDAAAAVKAMQSDDVIDAAINHQEAMNRRVLDRARNVLTADQIAQFEQIQQQQMEMQKMGLKMGREMFKGSNNPAPPAPPQPVEVTPALPLPAPIKSE